MAIVSAIVRPQHGPWAANVAFMACQAACLTSGLFEAGALDERKPPPRLVYATRAAALVAYVVQVAFVCLSPS